MTHKEIQQFYMKQIADSEQKLSNPDLTTEERDEIDYRIGVYNKYLIEHAKIIPVRISLLDILKLGLEAGSLGLSVYGTVRSFNTYDRWTEVGYRFDDQNICTTVTGKTVKNDMGKFLTGFFPKLRR